MLKRTVIAATVLATLTGAAHAATIHADDNGNFIKVYGEVGIGGHIGADYDYGEFYTDEESFIDDSFATLGVKGKDGQLHYRLELDYQRENWRGGTGDMALAIDKLFIGYEIDQHNYLEAGLTDTAFDDYDKWGDYTFDTTVETGEAGDQNKTVKYEGKYAGFKVGASFTYNAESSSGSVLGNIVNGYVGYFADSYSLVVGAEKRGGSDGESKYGEQTLIGAGARYAVTDSIHIGINGYVEEEDISQNQTTVNNTDPNNVIKVYNDYQTQENKGALLSAKYIFNPRWELVGSTNFEEFESWETSQPEWGASREWTTLGVNFKPSKSAIIAVELNQGESAQDAYAYARVYF